MEKIDFVIIWVDGGDPEWQAEKSKYQSDTENTDTRSIRYRDWDNLQYWFRAVEKYAPWVNKIHFVTWGHLPSWLDTTNPKLNIVNHKDYIPPEYLPTFSSHTIELNLHRIEGLAEQFVYFNDDMFLNKPVRPDDFFKNGLPCDTADVHCIYFANDSAGHFHGADIEVINPDKEIAHLSKGAELNMDITITNGRGYVIQVNPEKYHAYIFVTDTDLKSLKIDYEVNGKKESSCDEELSKYWASLGEIYINDAYGTSHRKHASNVGIAEQHAVTFAAGLAKAGLKPVFAVYSSFLQRGYDQLIHDVSVCNYNVTLAVDRAGIVGEDGVTHQGIFDVAFLNTIPNFTVTSPCYFDELRFCLNKAVDTEGPMCVRYPRGVEGYRPHWYTDECFE